MTDLINILQLFKAEKHSHRDVSLLQKPKICLFSFIINFIWGHEFINTL